MYVALGFGELVAYPDEIENRKKGQGTPTPFTFSSHTSRHSTHVDHAVALGDMREEAELQLPIVRHDEALARLGDEGLPNLVLVLLGGGGWRRSVDQAKPSTCMCVRSVGSKRNQKLIQVARPRQREPHTRMHTHTHTYIYI